MKKKIFIAAAIFISSTAESQTTTDSAKILKAVILTANKVEQKQEETGKVLTVISRHELDKSTSKSVGEILNKQVGVSIGGANSTLGTVQTIYIRGSAAANTLILMDGIPLYDASGITSEFDLNSFALDLVERIEILKGSHSVLYGSDAVAGVINIILRKPSTKEADVKLNLSAGSYNTYRGSINVSGAGKRGIEYFAGYSKIYSDGFSSAYDSSGRNDFDDDGFKQDAFQASIGFKPTERLSVKLYGKYNLNKAQIDAGAFTDDEDYDYQTRQTATGTLLKYQAKNVALHFNYNFNDYQRKYNNDSGHIGGYSSDPFAFYTKYISENYFGRSHFVELYTDINLNRKLNLVTGIEYRSNVTSQDYLYISNYGPYVPVPLGDDTAKTKQKSFFASFLFNNKKGLTAGIGGRYNDHSVYGSNGNFSVNPAYTFKKTKVFVNISSAYRVPSLYQLYSEFGNRVLKPEESLSYEAGVQYSGRIFTGRIVGFKRDTKDVFVFYTDPATFSSIYINEDRQKDKGVELEITSVIRKNVSLYANYTFADGEIETKDAAGKDTTFSNLYRRPKNLFNIGITWKPDDKVHINSHLRSVGSFYEPKFGGAPVKLSGYYAWDLYGEYAFHKKIKIFADLKNLTDQKYFDQEGFNTRRFNAAAGVQFSL